VSIIASVSKIPPNLSNCAPVSKTLPILRAMKDKRLDLSIKQQRKFEERKCVLPKYFPEWMRYVPPTHGYGANVLNDDFAYIHIFKNGGTTIAAQTGTRPHGATPRGQRFKNEGGSLLSAIPSIISYQVGPNVKKRWTHFTRKIAPFNFPTIVAL
jgi:hypothetical protein